MNRFFNGTTKFKKTTIFIFILLCLGAAVLSRIVTVNYDINDYLPDKTASTVSIEVMQKEFSDGIPNARVMVSDVTIPKALEYKEKLKEIKGVTAVTWLDDAADIHMPLSALDTSLVNTYYKDNNALFTVTVAEDGRLETVKQIRKIIGDKNAMSGSAVSIAAATENTLKEMTFISVISVLFVFVVLIFTCSSFFDAFTILIGLGVAVLLNTGTNAFFGEISFITNAAGSVLQLAVSLDYSVFLIHRFKECRKKHQDPREAMVDALCKSTSSILSSGLTTVIGFLALVLMKFKLGADLGMVLTKGVVISLITVFIFLPALILCTYKLTDKFEHRPFLPKFTLFGKFVRKISIPAVTVFAIILIPTLLASNSNNYLYGSSKIFSESTKTGHDTAEIDKAFEMSDTYVLLVPKGSLATEKALVTDLDNIPSVSGVISYVNTAGAEIPPEYLDKNILSQLESQKYRRIIISASVPPEGEETFSLVENIRSIADNYYPDSTYLAGEGVSTFDLKTTVESDMVRVNTIAIIAIFLILLFTMRSLLLPFILVISIEGAIWLNLAIPYFADSPIYYLAYLIISTVQLGATVDYAILLTNRYKENRLICDKKEAIVKTLSDVFVSIITSGSVLTLVGMLLSWISSNQIIAQLGLFIGRGAVLSLATVLLVCPGLLYIFDRFIVKKNRKESVENNEISE